jgi:hypothetical protein
MKIKVGLKVRYYYPFPMDKKHIYDDCKIDVLNSKIIKLKIINKNSILIINRNKENLKQMKVIK